MSSFAVNRALFRPSTDEIIRERVRREIEERETERSKKKTR